MNKVYEKIVGEVEADIKNNYADLNLNQAQITALTSIRYQYGNTGNFREAYTTYYLNGDLEGFQNNFRTNGSTTYYPLDTDSTRNKERRISSRVKANWTLFSTGVYLDSSGNEIVGGAAGNGEYVASSDVGISGYYSLNGRTYTIYKQFTGPWASHKFWDGTIANSGCSVTSVAIIMSGYGYSYNPGQMEDVAHIGTGNRQKMVEYFNTVPGMSAIEVGSYNREDIISHLQQGYPMILHVRNYTLQGKSGGPYAGHYLTLLGINEDGTQVCVGDPGSSWTSGWHEINDILKPGIVGYIKVY